MSSEIFNQLENELEDLQRNAKFCLNNYDYHHKNNEREIICSLQEILKEAYHDGREYEQAVEKVKNSLKKAQDLCHQVSQKLEMLAHNKDQCGPTMGHSASFKEESLSDDDSNNDQGDDENKENIFRK